MGRYGSIADHESSQFSEEADRDSRLVAVHDEGQLVGAMRWTWGGDAPFRSRHVAQYDLAEFLQSVPADQMVIGERFMVVPAYRGSDLLSRMFAAYMEFVNENRIQLVFGDCEPHLLNLYQGMGFRPYTRKNYNNPDAGYLIPLVVVAEDVAYLRSIASPLAAVLKDFGGGARVPERIDDLLAGGEGIRSQRLLDDEYRDDVFASLSVLGERRVGAFDGLSEDQVARCLAKSSTIECRQGDRIVKAGNVAKNMFIVLSGVVEVRDGDDSLAVLSPGDTFGEIAFLLQTPRTRDVYALSDNVRVLSLSESQVRKIMDSEPEIAAKILLNLARMLSGRLVGFTLQAARFS
jgi:CRP-like cAMP-binding protein/GNAT superfamily N-acetyltransferase